LLLRLLSPAPDETRTFGGAESAVRPFLELLESTLHADYWYGYAVNTADGQSDEYGRYAGGTHLMFPKEPGIMLQQLVG
jgi:hypothetical protein